MGILLVTEVEITAMKTLSLALLLLLAALCCASRRRQPRRGMMVFGDYEDYDDYEYNDYPRGGNRRAYGNGRPQRYRPREPRRNVNVNRKPETIGRRCVGRGAECITDFRF